MKRKLLLFALSGFTTLSLSAQTFTIVKEGTTENIAGGTHTINTSNTDGHEVTFRITNEGNAENYKVTRKIISEDPNWSDYLCWGGVLGYCYSSSQMGTDVWTSPDALNVQNGSTVDLLIHYDPADGVSSSAHYRYYIGRTVDSPVDSVDLVVNATVLNIKETKQDFSSLKIAPNPANDFVEIDAKNANWTSITIYDVLGNVVLNDDFNKIKKISTSSFKNGVYMIHLSAANVAKSIKRLVIKH